MNTDKVTLKSIWRGERPRIVNTILKKNKTGVLTLPKFKAYFKVTVIKRVWYCENLKKKKDKREY